MGNPLEEGLRPVRLLSPSGKGTSPGMGNPLEEGLRLLNEWIFNDDLCFPEWLIH